mgnify:CR=1 FL=1
MIGMPTINSIRQLRRDGLSITDIASATGVSRDTVYKYLKKDDFSPQLPAKQKHASKLDPYRPLIESWLDEDRSNWKKAATHIQANIPAPDRGVRRCRERICSEPLRQKAQETRKAYEDAYLDLDWAPGEAQADFGEADFYLLGTRRRMHYFVVTFPYSNVGFAQVLPSENSECVCEGLKRYSNIRRSSFKNRVRQRDRHWKAGLQGSAHHRPLRRVRSALRFAYSFCNPASGNEKGNVENKVGFIRRNLFTPPAQVHNIDIFNKHLLDKCPRLSDKPHWIKGEPESQLFVEDSLCLIRPSRPRPFDPVRYVSARANKQGKICLCGHHYYSSDPSLAGKTLIVALPGVSVFDTIPATARSYASTSAHTGMRPQTRPVPQAASAFVRKARRMEKLQGQKRDA